ncbi:MAG TPA: hypothetical protein DC034_05355 [Clostridium sp.]|nr:hypothetical protein [Clostridiales bacterium]HBC96209.1 hypothetical protein [Clostridium sp.]
MYPYMYPKMGIMPMCRYCRVNNKMFRNDASSSGGGTSTQPQPMPDMDMMENIDSNTQEIVSMLERHHPDIINRLICCNMSIDEVREYLSKVVRMALMHHMMHQM